jgi:hypothetical protein
LQPGPALQEIAYDRSVDGAAVHVLDEVLRQAHPQFDMHGRVFGPERNQRPRHHARDHARHDAELQVAFDR